MTLQKILVSYHPSRSQWHQQCVENFPARINRWTRWIHSSAHQRTAVRRSRWYNLLHTIVDFVNLVLQGRLPKEVKEIIFGEKIVALLKKMAELDQYPSDIICVVSPPSVLTNTWLREDVLPLKPTQVGVGVPGGAEAVIHATRRYMEDMPTGYCQLITVKLDFTNNFNSIRRDLILNVAAVNTPEIYRFVCEVIMWTKTNLWIKWSSDQKKVLTQLARILRCTWSDH